jgi:biopolymer transport protein ExbB
MREGTVIESRLLDKFKPAIIPVFIIIFFSFTPALSIAIDMRVVTEKARQELAEAKKEALDSRKQITMDRNTLKSKLIAVRQSVSTLQNSTTRLEDELAILTEQHKELTSRQANDEMEMNELSGTVLTLAQDLTIMLNASLFTPFTPDRLLKIEPILSKERFPGIDDMRSLANILFSETQFTGGVSLQKGAIIDRAGTEQLAEILLVGPFTAIYRIENEVGFLTSQHDNLLTALPVLPDKKVRRQLSAYMDGSTDSLIFDPSGGIALKQVTHRVTYIERIRDGGFFVWPILAIGVIALLIVLERIIFLSRVHTNTDKIMGKVNELADAECWDECKEVINSQPGRPVCNILKAGFAGRCYDRETVDSILQEAILREVPRLERFLAVLHVFAAIAPLLGLLGTVTGMIATFHVITLYGTGDPRLMAGGISEALITTMLGLCIAIPIMLVHTFLSRQVDHIIDDMEEKAVGLSNIFMRSSCHTGNNG